KMKEDADELTTELVRLKVQVRDASRLADEMKELTKKVDRIEEQIGFTASSKASPALQDELKASLAQFQGYLAKIGFPAPVGRLSVDIRSARKMEGNIAFYEAGTMVIDSRYASDTDILHRDYMFHLLADKYHADTEWPSYAIESALAAYFPCSFKGGPRF